MALGAGAGVPSSSQSAREKGEISLLTVCINNNNNNNNDSSFFSSRFVHQPPRESHGDLTGCTAPFYRWGD